jgi:hypothetical protein
MGGVRFSGGNYKDAESGKSFLRESKNLNWLKTQLSNGRLRTRQLAQMDSLVIIFGIRKGCYPLSDTG